MQNGRKRTLEKEPEARVNVQVVSDSGHKLFLEQELGPKDVVVGDFKMKLQDKLSGRAEGRGLVISKLVLSGTVLQDKSLISDLKDDIRGNAKVS